MLSLGLVFRDVLGRAEEVHLLHDGLCAQLDLHGLRARMGAVFGVKLGAVTATQQIEATVRPSVQVARAA